MNLEQSKRILDLRRRGMSTTDIAFREHIQAGEAKSLLTAAFVADLQARIGGIDIDGLCWERTYAVLTDAIAALKREQQNDEVPPTVPTGSGELRAVTGWRFGAASETQLATVHPDLQRLTRRALELSTVDFGVTEGRRSIEQQITYVKRNASSTYNSRHLHGLAVDVIAYVNGQATYKSDYYLDIHDAFVAAAKELRLPLRWGGDWNGDGKRGQSDWDWVHHELPRSAAYPDDPAVVAELKRRGLA